MSNTTIADKITEAFLAACHLELRALKPGNVHKFADGHGMTVADFEKSAAAAASHIADFSIPVGARVLRATQATFEAVGCNTNLGILLLCVPLAEAAQREARQAARSPDLQRSLDGVLADLGIDDTKNVYKAIRLANPGGLGDASYQNVHEEPTLDLKEAMALAADRDRIAAAYTNNFEDILGFGMEFFEAAVRAQDQEEHAVSLLYLAFLTKFLDTHILRKFNLETAQEVNARAKNVTEQLCTIPADGAHPLLMDFDRDLKEKGINPGTTADFVVATAFASALNRQLLQKE